jgi:hypothetical protein
VLTFREDTFWGRGKWKNILEGYVRDKKVRFIAYRHYASATGALNYHLYCAFANQVRFETVAKLFPTSTCVSVQGKLSRDAEYCDKEASFAKLGIEPAQGKRRDVGDAVDVKRKKRKISENEAAEGLETVDNLLQNMRREYDIALDDFKKQLETSKRETRDAQTELEASKEETKDAQRISDEFKTQLDVTAYTASAIIDQYRQTFVSDCTARGAVGFYVSTARTLGNIYAFQPPLRKEDKLIIQTNDCGSIRRALKSARLHYHPDRQGKGGYWCQTICTEITKLLNCISAAACEYTT